MDRSAASIIIDKAMDAGIPVVFFNREPVEEDMNRWEKLYYVGADAKESAVLQGNILVEAYRDDPRTLDLNGDGLVSYVLLEGETSHQDSLIRTEWSIQTLKAVSYTHLRLDSCSATMSSISLRICRAMFWMEAPKCWIS